MFCRVLDHLHSVKKKHTHHLVCDWAEMYTLGLTQLNSQRLHATHRACQTYHPNLGDILCAACKSNDYQNAYPHLCCSAACRLAESIQIFWAISGLSRIRWSMSGCLATNTLQCSNTPGASAHIKHEDVSIMLVNVGAQNWVGIHLVPSHWLEHLTITMLDNHLGITLEQARRVV